MLLSFRRGSRNREARMWEQMEELAEQGATIGDLSDLNDGHIWEVHPPKDDDSGMCSERVRSLVYACALACMMGPGSKVVLPTPMNRRDIAEVIE